MILFFSHLPVFSFLNKHSFTKSKKKSRAGFRGKRGILAYLPSHWIYFIFKLNFNHKFCKSFHSVFTIVEPGEFDHIFNCGCKGLKILCSFNPLLYLQRFAQQNRSPRRWSFMSTLSRD